MLWVIALLLGLTIVYLAARYGRFRSWVEPALSIAVAVGLAAAFLIWLSESTPEPPEPAPSPMPAGLAASDIELENLTFERNQSERSYRLRGTARNTSALTLEYIRLTVTLEDCPEAGCKPIGDDTALVLVRIPGGETRPFETFLTFPFRPDEAPRAPKWSYRIVEAKGATAR
ncbi:hypothetical protein ABIE78_000999 [Sinorhizobium fredii]|jgi:hypothetical protein|uniref:Transmembrane protein n=1 Tax=Sinorhizobium fredii (strain USDA 257) TaxID=1185652 RepID=I3XB51_SINF2|nr:MULTISPECIES: hypothetical protein [Sinorhizobium]AFL53107.1 hypothetical protein USDA257_c45690 [Sinorhizobium fredii USDA 257]PDT84847.1 hypothetical protein CO676_07510 [Sinorhizobium sp. BJ1]